MTNIVKFKRFKIEIKGEGSRIKGFTNLREDQIFLNNILTNNIINLSTFCFNYNLMLKPNGNPVEEFFVFNMGSYFLLDTDCHPKIIIDEFERIKLSLKVYFRDVTENYEHYFLWGEDSRKLIKDIFGNVPEKGKFVINKEIIVANNYLRLREEGFDLIGKGVERFINLNELKVISLEEFEDIRIKRKIPAIHKELKEGFSPLEADIESYAIDFNKGCYTGQEAIARVHYKGRLPRKLVLLRTVGTVREGDTIMLDEEKVGVVTSVSPLSPLALGYINRKILEAKNMEFETPQGKLFLL